MELNAHEMELYMGLLKGILANANSKRSIITPQEARKLMGNSGSYVLLDVRTQSEYRQDRIDGAALIPVDELAGRAAVELPDKQMPIFIYCQSGARAAKAVKILVQLGYKNVLSFGGIMDWPYGTVKGKIVN